MLWLGVGITRHCWWKENIRQDGGELTWGHHQQKWQNLICGYMDIPGVKSLPARFWGRDVHQYNCNHVWEVYEGKILVWHVYCAHIDGLKYMYEHSLCYKGIDSCMIVITCKPIDGISYIFSHPVHSSINASIYCEYNTATITRDTRQAQAKRGKQRWEAGTGRQDETWW